MCYIILKIKKKVTLLLGKKTKKLKIIRKKMNYITDFKKAILKRISTGEIECGFYENVTFNINPLLSNINIPPKIGFYLNSFQPVIINNSSRIIELLHVSKIEFLDDRFLMFSKINNIERICFDTYTINSACEWDIVNYSNKYLITKTISCFLTNKIWAWIDRGRTIWKIEIYPN